MPYTVQANSRVTRGYEQLLAVFSPREPCHLLANATFQFVSSVAAFDLRVEVQIILNVENTGTVVQPYHDQLPVRRVRNRAYLVGGLLELNYTIFCNVIDPDLAIGASSNEATDVGGVERNASDCTGMWVFL